MGSDWDPDVLSQLTSAAWSGLLGTLLVEVPVYTLSSAAHRTTQALLRAVHLQGAQVCFTYPTQCDPATESSYIHLCQELAVHCIHITLPSTAKSLTVCCTDANIVRLQDQQNNWQQLQTLLEAHCTKTGEHPVPIDRIGRFLPSFFLPKRPAVCDSAGLHSSADHTSNNLNTKRKPLQRLASQMLSYLKHNNLINTVSEHLTAASEDSPLSAEHGSVLAELIRLELAPHCDPNIFHSISAGQPFRLQVLQCLARAIQDKDADLPVLLEEGVPTGAFEPLPSSGQWVQAQSSLDFSADFSPASLEHCRGNWLAAESNPALLTQLVQDEVDKGFVKKFEGDEAQAASHWPNGTAIGKLNIVTAEGRDPRLVLDSSVCGLNHSIHLPEHVALPTASDVQRTFLSGDCYRALIALSLDFKAAHKCCKVRQADQGTLLFRLGHRTVPLYGLPFWRKIFCILVAASWQSYPSLPACTALRSSA